MTPRRPRFQLVDRRATREGHDPAAARASMHQRGVPRSLHDHTEAAPDYRLSADLETAINTALAVDAPLLLTGAPGTGKTQVAHYLGWFFGLEVFAFHVQSTSTAQELCYDFDAVAYLHWAQHGSEAPGEGGGDGQPALRRGRGDFVRKRALWRSFDQPNGAVVLIDEIDKAPRDFPNDLLHVLDQQWFEHPFEDRKIRPQRSPIVVITSNAERRLPDAFLRRCIHQHLTLTRKLVEDIVQSRLQSSFPGLSDDVREAAIDRFFELADWELTKPPTTAELLSWLAVLAAQGTRAADLQTVRRDLPGVHALIKLTEDWQKL
ncbi:MAG: MoxR family ATPase [Planctomycetota bacterium]